MTDKPALASQPDKFEQLLADLEGKYDKPDPGNIALGANRFEQILNSVILPFVGVNAFLFGGIALRQIYPEYVLSLFLSYLSAAVLLLAWIYRHRNRTTEIPTVFLSAAPTFLIAAALTFPLPIASSVVVLLVTCVFAILVYTSRIPQTAVPLYAIYLPILLERILADQVLRIVVESLTLLPMGILFIRRKFRVATSAVVVSAVLTGALESSSEGYSVPVIALLLILVCFAIWYEVRIAKADYSASRMTLDHGLLVLLAYLALYAFRFASSDRLIWTWALTILVYQAVQSARERLSDPTRVAATAIPLTIALWMTDLIHHISPAVIGLGVGLFACLPGVGILDQEDMKRLNYLPVFFVAAAISMGTVLVQTGALKTMTAVMFDWMRPLLASSKYALPVVPYWTAFMYHIFLGNEIGMLATSMPGLMSFAHANGIHALPLGLIWAFAAGGKIFVYQSGVLVAGYSYGYFNARDVFRVGLCVTIIESLVLLLIVPFYWPLIGIR